MLLFLFAQTVLAAEPWVLDNARVVDANGERQRVQIVSSTASSPTWETTHVDATGLARRPCREPRRTYTCR